MQAFLQIILVAAFQDISENCHSQCQKQVSPWLIGPCPDAQEETLMYPCADRDLPPLATSWRPSEENQWIDNRAGGQWGQDNRLVRQLMPSHPRSGAGRPGTDQTGKMPCKTLSELGLHLNAELWAPIISSGTRGQTGVLSPAFPRQRIPGAKAAELVHPWSYRLNLEGLQEGISTALCVTPSHVSPATSDSHQAVSPALSTPRTCFTATDREKNMEPIFVSP